MVFQTNYGKAYFDYLNSTMASVFKTSPTFNEVAEGRLLFERDCEDKGARTS